MTIAEMIKELERYKNELGEDTKVSIFIKSIVTERALIITNFEFLPNDTKENENLYIKKEIDLNDYLEGDF